MATFPTNVKNFGTDRVNGDVIVPGDVNDLRAEVAAVQSLNAYKITPSIASNNLTLAIKALSGNDASATEPISFMIAGAGRTLTGALSVTVNAGTNIFNAGAAKLLGNDIDFFVYIGWRAASSTLFVLISRLPLGRTYADFSATSTSERYGAFSGSAPASTDVVRVIGRFAAQNSGTAAFNWSIPSAFVVHEPIFETRWLNFNFFSSNITIGNGTTNVSRYKITMNKVDFYNKWTLGSTSAIPTSPVFSPPLTPSSSQQTYDGPIGGARYNDTGTANYLGAIILAGTEVQPVAYTVGGTYAGMTGLTATVPHTWATTDVMEHQGSYEI